MSHPSWVASVHHDGSARYVSQPMGKLGDAVQIALRAGRSAPIRAVFLRTHPDGEQIMAPMQHGADDDACQWWHGTLRLEARRMRYRFVLVTNEGRWTLNAGGMVRHTPRDDEDFTLLADYTPPAWVRDAVFYQIFPDRFCDGDSTSNVRSGEYRAYQHAVVAKPWGAEPAQHGAPGGGSLEFCGGDLPGITQRLDYLRDLGITALYLTPIFTAPSNHKYDSTDYYHVDPHFGGDAALVELRRALDARGMRLMLDIVPNHCSSMHPWFLAAQADPQAPTAEYFTFDDTLPHGYATWLHVRSLAKLNYRSRHLRDVMYAGPDAIMRHWLRPPYRIDAWRLDVANMLARQGATQLAHTVMRGIRRVVKAEAPETYLLGENFFDGTPQLQGYELDATMNYQGFMFPTLRWLAPRDPETLLARPYADPQPLPTEALAAQWQTQLASIPWMIALQQFNLLGSHDTPRVLTALEGDRDLVRVAIALLVTFPGVPCIFYGDEIGLEGGAAPACRRCMPWDESEWDAEIRAWYQRMIALRQSSPSLRSGGFQILHAEGDTIAFQRETPDERIIVVASRAPHAGFAFLAGNGGVEDGTVFREIVTSAEDIVTWGWLSALPAAHADVQIWRASTDAGSSGT